MAGKPHLAVVLAVLAGVLILVLVGQHLLVVLIYRIVNVPQDVLVILLNQQLHRLGPHLDERVGLVDVEGAAVLVFVDERVYRNVFSEDLTFLHAEQERAFAFLSRTPFQLPVAPGQTHQDSELGVRQK